jgi:serine/threonine protein kinase
MAPSRSASRPTASPDDEPVDPALVSSQVIDVSAQLPQRIGKYPVLRKLGEGATSEVFLCRDEFQSRDVAIKRVRPAVAGDPAANRYSDRFFAAEAALVGRLQHPNVVKIYDAVSETEEQYLVMEYVAGTTLRP